MVRKWLDRLSLLLVGVLLGVLAFNYSGVSLETQQDNTSQTVGLGSKVLVIADQRVSAAGTADYNCDGVDDDIQFQLALDALPGNGGKIIVLSGNYSFSSPVSRAISNVSWQGAGSSTYISYDAVNFIFDIGAQSNWTFRSLELDVGGVNTSSATEWTYQDVSIGTTYYAYRTSTDITADEWNVPVGREATYLVAASDAPNSIKAQADYVTNGVNDQSEINTAIAAAIAASPGSPGIIQLSPGTFYVSSSGLGGGSASTIFLNSTASGLWLRGSGMHSTRLLLGNSQVQNVIGVVAANNVTISDMEIDGNRGNNVDPGTSADNKQNNIYFNLVRYSFVERVKTHSAIYHGVFNYQGIYNRVTNNIIYDNGYRPIHAHNDTHYNYYGQNLIYQNGAEALGMGGLFVIYNNSIGNVIEGNIIIDEKTAGIVVAGGTALAWQNVINDNFITNSNNNYYGILFIGGVGGQGSRYTVISGNTIRLGRHCINFESGNVHDYVAITGNTFYTEGGDGIHAAVSTNYINIVGNNIWSSPQHAIRLEDADYGIISNNVLRAHDTAPYSGISLQNSTNNLIEGNVIIQGRYSIDEATDGGNSTNVIINNIESGIAASPTMNLQSTHVRGNTGYVTENSGSASIVSGVTFITVSHGLSTNATRVQVTPRSLGNSGKFWITINDTTQFHISVDADPGAATAVFDWRATVGEGN